MKTYLTLILVFGYLSANCQGIIAGDTATPGIVYVDLVPHIHVSVPYPNNSNTYNLDFNNDGNQDFKFTANWQSAMGFSSEATSCMALGQTEIAYFMQYSNWVDCFDLLEVIGPSEYWDDGGTLKSHWDSYDTSYTNGIFGNGYIGFRFNENNQIKYGWIRVYASASSITIFNFAYQGNLTEIEDHLSCSEILLKPNPVKDLLFVDIPERNGNTVHSFFIVNILGKIVIEGEISSSNQSIDCSLLNAGYYFIYLIDGDTKYKPQKFIKY